MAPVSDLPQGVKNFLDKNIHSLEELEILLLLSSSGDRMWPIVEVHRQIRSTELSIAKCLEELQSHGLLTSNKMPDPVYRFFPVSEELQQEIRQFEALYKERRVQILQYVCERALNELRNFSDAFKLRRDKK